MFFFSFFTYCFAIQIHQIPLFKKEIGGSIYFFFFRPSTSSGTNVASKTANDSPDSGMPSSRKRSEAELSGITALQNEISESTLPPDLSAKLIGIFQKNLKSFQKSLDEIWVSRKFCGTCFSRLSMANQIIVKPKINLLLYKSISK